MHQSENLLAQYGADSYLRVKRAIADLRAGRGVMVVDDENRENEGDLILSTDFTAAIKNSGVNPGLNLLSP